MTTDNSIYITGNIHGADVDKINVHAALEKLIEGHDLRLGSCQINTFYRATVEETKK